MLVIVGIVIVLLCAKVAINIANKPDDPKLIQLALTEAIQASREGKPGGVMDLLSQNLKLNGTDVAANANQIRDFIRKQHPDITVDDPSPQITGNEARIVSPVQLDFGLIGKRSVPDVTMIFRKEDATEYLIIPTRKWRLTEVMAPDYAVAEFVSGNGGP
jgi:hypothetical protein